MTAYQKVRQVLIEEMSVEGYLISPDTPIVLLEMDSLDYSQLVLELEEAFGIDVPDDDFAELRTVGDVAEYAEKQAILRIAGESIQQLPPLEGIAPLNFES